MSPGTTQHGTLLQKLRGDYRSAFRRFAQAVEELMSLQQHAAVNPMEINEAHARIRDAQNSCREARDRLACLLLEARRQTLLQPQAAMPARLELLTFVSRMTSAFTQEQDANVTMHRPTPIKNNRAVFV